jgi:hypothetical protein
MGSWSPPHHLSALEIFGLSHVGVLENQPTGLNRVNQNAAQLPYSVLPAVNAIRGGEGILTFFPLVTPFGLTLGTD